MSEQPIKPTSKGKNLFQLFKDSLVEDEADIAEIGRQLRESREQQAPHPPVQPDQFEAPQADQSAGRPVGTSAAQQAQANARRTDNPCVSMPKQVDQSAGQHLGTSIPNVDASTTRQPEVDKSSPQVNDSATQVISSASQQPTCLRRAYGRNLDESTSRQLSASTVPSDISELCLTHREILQVAATVSDGEINYREMSEWTGIAQGTCRDAMIRLREKKNP